MKVSAVVVTYNRLTLLKECLQHLFNQSYQLNSIIVVNNDSSDGTKEYLQNLKNNCSILIPINSTKNLGGAGGFSLGTKVACERTSSDYVWLMDDDTMPTEHSLYKLVINAKKLHGYFGFLCSNVRWWKNKQATNVPKVSFSDWTEPLKNGCLNIIKVSTASFVSLFVPVTKVRHLGLPISQMFIWGDDVEYTTRLSRTAPCYFISDSIVLHKSAENNMNENIFNSPKKRILYYRCMYRNRLYTARKYYNFSKKTKLLLSDLFTLIRIPFIAKSHKLLKTTYVLEGIVMGLFFNPKIMFPK